MAESDKPEINLEVCSGFFRIPTEKAVYNITVLTPEESSVVRVVDRIVDAEKDRPVEPTTPGMPAQPDDDDFYKVVSSDLYHDIGNLAKSLSSTIMELPAEDRRGKRAELDEAGEKIEHAKDQLKEIVTMTEKATMEIMDQVEKVQGQSNGIKDLLSMLKDHPAFGGPENLEGSESEDLAPEILGKLQTGLSQAKDLLQGIQEGAAAIGSGVQESAPKKKKAPKEKKKTRYLFTMDVVFQTMYELCTNETVKTHISTAREQADEIFTIEIFHDQMSETVAGLEVDSDDFYQVPLSDVFRSLHAACTDDKIKNLFQRMEKNKDSIFLDQSLPLEAPPTEEVTVEAEFEEESQEDEVQEASGGGVVDPRLGELADLLDQGLGFVQEMEDLPACPPNQASEFSCMTREDQVAIFHQIEEAFGKSSDICLDVSKITEALSFQDLSGQQILKIIKLLSDFQVQLLGIVVSFGSQLKHKEEDRELTLEESKRLAQDDVDAYMKGLTTEEVGGEGSLDQDTVNQLLEDMGF